MDSIISFLGNGQTLVILKGLVLLLAAFGVWWLTRWAAKKAVEQAKEQEDQQKVKDKQDTIPENESEDQKLKDDSKKVDDFLSK